MLSAWCSGGYPSTRISRDLATRISSNCTDPNKWRPTPTTWRWRRLLPDRRISRTAVAAADRSPDRRPVLGNWPLSSAVHWTRPTPTSCRPRCPTAAVRHQPVRFRVPSRIKWRAWPCPNRLRWYRSTYKILPIPNGSPSGRLTTRC